MLVMIVLTPFYSFYSDKQRETQLPRYVNSEAKINFFKNSEFSAGPAVHRFTIWTVFLVWFE